MRRLEASAEYCTRAQDEFCRNVVHFVKTLVLQGHVKPLCYVWRQSYDETPLKLRVSYTPDEGATQLAKLFVVEGSWNILLKYTDPSQQGEHNPYLLLSARWSPALMAAESTKAESILGVLKRAPAPPLPEVDRIFKETQQIRVVEVDEGPSNGKAERMYQQTKPLQSWLHMLWPCTAHKIHTTSAKITALAKPTMTGIINCLLALQRSQNLERFLDCMSEVLRKRLVIIQRAPGLSSEAKAHRKSVLSLFLPPVKRSSQRASVLMFAAWYNGDWRGDQVQHYCAGCCPDAHATFMVMDAAARKLMKSLRPSQLCKANWAEWPRPLSLLGVLAFAHNLLQTVFLVAFGTSMRPGLLSCERAPRQKKPTRHSNL